MATVHKAPKDQSRRERLENLKAARAARRRTVRRKGGAHKKRRKAG